MKNIIFNMSGEPVEGVAGAEILDFSALDGTNCYCSTESQEAIASAFASAAGEGPCINWIDTGDYHYLSALTTARIERPYILLVVDHHPDTQEPAFEGVLSCGGWVREAFTKQAGATPEHVNRGNLKQVLLVGINPDLSLEYLDLMMDDVLAIEETEFRGLPQAELKLSVETREMLTLLEPGLPVYISIDIDALSPCHARTNWDQGSMSLDELKAVVAAVARGREVLGADVCGGITQAKGATESDGPLNASTRADLQSFLETLFV